MKSPSKTFARTFLAGAALLMTSVAFAEEEIIEPKIAICDFHVEIEPFDGEISEKEAPIDEEIFLEDEVIVDEEEVSLDDEISVDDEEVVVEDVVDDSTEDLIDDSDLVYTCWTKDMLYRNNVEGDVYLMQTSGGPRSEDFQTTSATTQSPAPQAADEVSAVSTVLKSNVSTSIHRVATPATAVKSGGRVFLR